MMQAGEALALRRPASRMLFPPRAQHKVVDEKDARGSLEIFLPPPDFCVTIARGHLSAVMARRWIDVIDAHFKRGSNFRTFHDWAELASYDSNARRLLTTWLIANTKHVVSADFLVASKLVAMGVSAANVMTTLAGLTLVAHTSRATFEAAWRAARVPR
jgi:hypothetical protein